MPVQNPVTPTIDRMVASPETSPAAPALVRTVLATAVRLCGRTGVRLLLSGGLAVGLLVTAPTADAHAETVTKVHRAVRIAVAQKGDPYAYGASGPGRFDCSGLTYYSFRRAGFTHIPRTSSAQAHWSRHIKRSNMRRGDLMFFYDSGGVYHVGVFAGWKNGRRWVLHSPYSGARVRTEPVWTTHWFAGTARR